MPRVDLGTETAGKCPCLRLTSKAQPFGYDAETGNKLDVDKRRKARDEIEPKAREQREPNPKQFIRIKDEAGNIRNAYDQELFDGEIITPDGLQMIQPPLPYGATKGKTFMLHELLAAWRKRSRRDPAGGIEALCRVVADGDMPEGSTAIDLVALQVLDEAFRKVEEAQVAMLLVEPAHFRQPHRDLLAHCTSGSAPAAPRLPTRSGCFRSINTMCLQRDNQDENLASIRMRKGRRWREEGRA